MAKGYVVFDLSAGYGDATLVPGKSLPRHDKKQLELFLANQLLQSIAVHEGRDIRSLRSNDQDPPDVIFDLGASQTGLELAELLPENRLERDAIIHSTKAALLERLQLSDRTRNWVITIMLEDDYASKIKVPLLETLAPILREFFSSVGNAPRQPCAIGLPGDVKGIRRIRAEPWDLHGDPRITDPREPLVVFSAQHTHVVPDRDFASMLEARIGRKALHGLAIPTWLLLWSSHYAFAPLRDDLVRHIDAYVQRTGFKYERVFYLHLHPFGDITEFTKNDDSDGSPE